MSDAGLTALIAFLTSIGYGVASAIFPPVNAEAYVVLSQVSAVIGVFPIAIGVAIGQTIGKLALFYSVAGRPAVTIRPAPPRPVTNKAEGRVPAEVRRCRGVAAPVGRYETLGPADRADRRGGRDSRRCTR